MTSETAPLSLRLDRLIVSRGHCGRRGAQKLIRRGHVTSQGETLNDPQMKVSTETILYIDGEESAPLPLLLAYHKPLGQLSTLRDPWGRDGLDTALPLKWRGLFHAVGRLDADTTGLLLFSREGKITQRLLHPKREVERSYWAKVAALPEDLSEKIALGVETSLGTFCGRVDQIRANEIYLSVREGKNRMVRRMLHNAGASVLSLHRVKFGTIMLEDLPPRELRVLTKIEVDMLISMTSAAPKAALKD